MCGRFVLHSPPRYLAGVFSARYEGELDGEYSPSWNISPTSSVIGIAAEGDARVLGRYRWGLIPSWARDPSIGGRAFNARSETVATKPMFRSAFAHRRLVVPADGFYEWARLPSGRKQPYYFSRADGAPLALAGLYEFWRNGTDAPVLATCTILTTTAGLDLAGVHDRQPVILEPEAVATWIFDDGDRDALEGLCRPSEADLLERRAVQSVVGRSSANGPELIAALEETAD